MARRTVKSLSPPGARVASRLDFGSIENRFTNVLVRFGLVQFSCKYLADLVDHLHACVHFFDPAKCKVW